MAKITLENRNPAITVKAEFEKLSVEYFVDPTTRLTIKPIVPESSRFLLRYSAAIPYVNFAKKLANICDLPFNL